MCIIVFTGALVIHLISPFIFFFTIQDDGVGGELYQETLMGHDLLSDPTTDPQSTINLRDLE